MPGKKAKSQRIPDARPEIRTIHRPRRAVLFVPAANEKALAKLPSLACDAVIFDLEDSVAPEAKAAARERLRAWFSARPKEGPECIIRVNPLASEWGTEDLLAARACAPDAILLPKVDTPRDIHDFDDALDEADAPENLKLWIMVETPKAMLNIGALAEFGRNRAARLDCFVAGHQRPHQGYRRAGHARPPLHRALAAADGACRARRRAGCARRRQQRFQRHGRLCAANAPRARPWGSTARR